MSKPKFEMSITNTSNDFPAFLGCQWGFFNKLSHTLNSSEVKMLSNCNIREVDRGYSDKGLQFKTSVVCFAIIPASIMSMPPSLYFLLEFNTTYAESLL